MDPKGQDFRRGKRVTFATHVALAPVSGCDDLIENASTIDISESGARVRLSAQIMPGQIVDLFLGKRPEQCRVVWTSPPGASRNLIAGLEFLLPDARHPQTPPGSSFEPVN